MGGALRPAVVVLIAAALRGAVCLAVDSEMCVTGRLVVQLAENALSLILLSSTFGGLGLRRSGIPELLICVAIETRPYNKRPHLLFRAGDSKTAQALMR